MAEMLTANHRDMVPADLLFDYDIYGGSGLDADYQLHACRQLHRDGVPDIFWTPHHGGHWVVTRAEDIRAIIKDHEHFSSRSITVPKPPETQPKMLPLQVDPPHHTQFRDLVKPFLSPQAVNALTEDVRHLAIDLIEGFKSSGQCEFIGDFATHLPVAIFMKIAGLPEEDRPYLLHCCEETIRGETVEIRVEGRRKLGAYSLERALERRGGNGTDMISAVANAKFDGAYMDDIALTGMVTLLLLGGLDTVASNMGFSARFLAMNPAHRRQLIDDPRLIPGAVEELLRRFGVINLGREVIADRLYKGVEFRTGDMVIMPTYLDGLDERQFREASRVDFERRGNVMHSTFGGHVHRCMGSMLARIELRVFVEEWLKRIPDFEVDTHRDIHVSARAVVTIEQLPLMWRP